MEHGFWSTLQQLIDSLDPLGEKNALRVKNILKILLLAEKSSSPEVLILTQTLP
jgi:hypothetical protein